MPATQVALLWAAVATTSTLLSVPLSAWTDRVGRLPLLIGGWIAARAAVRRARADRRVPGPLWFDRGDARALHGGDRRRRARADRRSGTPTALGSAYGWYYLVKGLLLLPASAAFGCDLVRHGLRRRLSCCAAVLVDGGDGPARAWVLPAVRAHARPVRSGGPACRPACRARCRQTRVAWQQHDRDGDDGGDELRIEPMQRERAGLQHELPGRSARPARRPARSAVRAAGARGSVDAVTEHAETRCA